MIKLKKIRNLNEIVFSLYVFSFLVFLPIPDIWGEIPYQILYAISTGTLFIITFIKNKKLMMKKDAILLAISIIIFATDWIFRRNEYIIETIVNFIKNCYITCYFFNRTKSIKNTIKYLSLFSKLGILVYIFAPLYVPNTYMGYGYTIMLPSLLVIYIYFLIKKDYSDLVFLILGFVGVFILGNRASLLSIILMFLLTSKLLIKSFKNAKKRIKKNNYKVIKKTGIILLLFVISFVVSYLLFMKILQKELIVKSYSLDKYDAMLKGQFETIFSGRLAIYSKAMGVIKDTYTTGIIRALLGNGTGYFRTVNEGVYSHSIIFDLLIEYGIIGAILFGCIFLYCLFRWFRDSKKEKYLFGAYLLCLAFPKLLLSLYFQKEMGLFLFIIFVIKYFPLESKKLLKKNKEI